MKYRIKFKGGGSQEYVVETVAGFDSVNDVIKVMRQNFGFKGELLVYDQHYTKCEDDNVQSGRTFIVRRLMKEKIKRCWYR